MLDAPINLAKKHLFIEKEQIIINALENLGRNLLDRLYIHFLLVIISLENLLLFTIIIRADHLDIKLANLT
jgi:hypothetical protein